MAAKINIFADEWVDMVFKSKNHAYGAFILRKESSKRHLFAFIVASVFFVLGVSSPILLKSIMKNVEKESDTTVRIMTDIKLDKPKPVEDLLKDIPPPPPVLRNTIKFTPPVIKPDDQVAEEEIIKTNKEVIDTKAAVGAVEVTGGSDDVALPPAEEKTITEEVEQVFVVVEQMPEFPGGNGEITAFIRSATRYPVLAQENGISGKVYVSFVIDKNGNVTKVKVIRGIGGGCDEEAVRVISKMPAWKPGKQGGKSVPVSYTLPVNFVLQN